jgi:hypothetical protein
VWDNPLTPVNESLGFVGDLATINVSSVGDGTVTVAGFTDTLTGVETLSFDNGIWSVTSNEWVPLIGVTNSETQVIGAGANSYEIDGNLVNLTLMLDNTLIPLTGITVGDVEILDPDGPNGVRTVTLAGADAASFALFDVFNPLTNEAYQELRFVGGRAAGAGAATNYEVKPDYHVTLNVADGSGGSAINYTLNITDVNDNAPLITSPDQIHVTDGSGTNNVVYRITATDLDTQGAIADPREGVLGSAQGALTYALAPAGPGNDNALFTFSDNGEIRFAAPPVFTEGDNVKTLVVQASDGAHVTEHTVTVVIEPTGAPPPDPTLIEAIGDFALRNIASQYVIDPIGAGANVNVTFMGTPVGPNSFAGWSALQTEEAAGGGFHVLWEHTNQTYSFWTTDAAGNFVSTVETPLANQTPGQYEDIFGVDLDGDGIIGVPGGGTPVPTIVESVGDFTLGHDGTQLLIGDGFLPEIGVSASFAPVVGPNSFAGWTALQTEEVEGGPGVGYYLLWEHTDQTYSLWTLNSSGVFQSTVETPLANQTPDLYEDIFGVDLDGNGNIGGSLALFSLPQPSVTLIESNGDFTLGHDGSQYLIGDGVLPEIGMTASFAPLVGPDSFAGWSAIEAEEAAGGGFHVLWEHTDGTLSFWTVDAAGEFQSTVETPAASITPELLNEYQAIFGFA